MPFPAVAQAVCFVPGADWWDNVPAFTPIG